MENQLHLNTSFKIKTSKTDPSSKLVTGAICNLKGTGSTYSS